MPLGTGAAATGAVLWRADDAHWPGDGGSRRDWPRFIAAVGTVLSSLFTLVLFAQWLGAVMHEPREPLPRLRDSADAYLESLDPRRVV